MNHISPCDLTARIKSIALGAGFARVGVTAADPVAGRDRFVRWLADGCHAKMSYLARNVEKRFAPARLVPGARTVICLGMSYAPPEGDHPHGPFIARYARGRNYHKVLKKRCAALTDEIRRIDGGFEGRVFVDSAPVAERSLAASAGIGWIGRNGCLIAPGAGSYVVLCQIVCNLRLCPDEAIDADCGDCRACLDACPTGALLGDGLVDARRCISYLTIENRGPILPEHWPAIGTRLFGCDACQQACPHNRDVPAGDPELCPSEDRPSPQLADVLRWQPADWDTMTRGRALRRANLEMFLRNAVIAAGNSDQADLAGPLEELARRMPQLGGEIEWALGRLSDVQGD